MPSFVSHAILADKLYDKYESDEDIFKIEIDKDDLKTFSLGSDLSMSSTKLKLDPHQYRTREFFLKLIDYIKEYKLYENKYVMACLYGHISHYFFDLNTHPFVNYLAHSSKQVGFIDNHILIEAYMDRYLVNCLLNDDIKNIKASFFNKGNLKDQDVVAMLGDVYGKLYGDYFIVSSYKNTLRVLSLVHSLNNIVSKETLKRKSGFNEFLNVNNLSIMELVNFFKDEYTNPFSGEIRNDSYFNMYYRAMDETVNAINEINNYLYLDKSFYKVSSCFDDLSYDTGIKCEKGVKIKYLKKD